MDHQGRQAVVGKGDSPRADSGGEPLGIRTVLVSPQPPDRRPAGLLPVLTAAQLC